MLTSFYQEKNLQHIEKNVFSSNTHVQAAEFISRISKYPMKDVHGKRLKAALGSSHIPHLKQTKSKLHGLYPEPLKEKDQKKIVRALNELDLLLPVEDLFLLNKKDYKNFPSFQPESLFKVLLRAKYGLHVYKDGLLHFSITNAPLSAFKPIEINVSIAALHQLGYYFDYHGKPLSNLNQLIPLKPFDIILPNNLIPKLLNILNFISHEKAVLTNQFNNSKRFCQSSRSRRLQVCAKAG